MLVSYIGSDPLQAGIRLKGKKRGFLKDARAAGPGLNLPHRDESHKPWKEEEEQTQQPGQEPNTEMTVAKITFPLRSGMSCTGSKPDDISGDLMQMQVSLLDKVGAIGLSWKKGDVSTVSTGRRRYQRVVLVQLWKAL